MTHHFMAAGRLVAVRVFAAAQHSTPPALRRLEVSVDRVGSSTRVCLRGTLDTVSASAYDSIIAAAAAPTRQLHLDLNGLAAATRAGCRAVHVAAKLLHGRGSRMTIYGARPNVVQTLLNTGFDNLMDFRTGIAPSVTETPPVGNRLVSNHNRIGADEGTQK